MIRIGLTGTLGAGKSAVGRLFESWGALRIDADQLARQAIAPGTPGEAAVIERFGDAVLDPDGTIDRTALRTIVFADGQARADLEAIVHPAVDGLRAVMVAEGVAKAAGVAVLEIPLLFEKAVADEFDHVVVVDAPPEKRLARVIEGRGLTPEMFEAIDRVQWSGERKRAAADAVIWNDGTEEDLAAEARRVWEEIVDDTPATGATDSWLVDLHMHTSASHDCLSDPADVVARAAAIGLDRIAVTDHDQIEGAFAARDIDPTRVIVGEEVRTSEGLDLIGLWLERRIDPGGSFREVAEAIHAQGGLVYVPHPFDSRRGTDEAFLDRVADVVDAVEGFNARVHDRKRNERAAAWAAANDLPCGAGSDAHTLREIGRARVRLAPFRDPGSFLDSLRGGSIEGRESSPLVHLASTWAKFVR